MDTITHGIAGALIGKAFFAGPQRQVAGPEPAATARLAVFATTLGSVFPDGDVVFGWFEGNNLATLELHRGWTHSFVCMPVLAVILALLTRRLAQRLGRPCPSFWILTVAYGAGIASHIVLDLITSFGTMIWSPISNARATWDLVFILDFLFTAIALLLQLAAWVYRRREGNLPRAAAIWLLSTLVTAALWWIARVVGVGFRLWIAALLSAAFAVLLFLPRWRGWGFSLRRATWCRAGCVALVVYLGLCAVAHQVTLARVRQFAASRGLQVETLGALPAPPSALRWTGLIRTPDGVYVARMRLYEPPPQFEFFADSPANGYFEAARRLPAVKTYLWFARFPVYRFLEENGLKVVELADLRFFAQRRGPTAFTYRVAFDDQGNVVHEGWVRE